MHSNYYSGVANQLRYLQSGGGRFQNLGQFREAGAPPAGFNQGAFNTLAVSLGLGPLFSLSLADIEAGGATEAARVRAIFEPFTSIGAITFEEIQRQAHLNAYDVAEMTAVLGQLLKVQFDLRGWRAAACGMDPLNPTDADSAFIRDFLRDMGSSGEDPWDILEAIDELLRVRCAPPAPIAFGGTDTPNAVETPFAVRTSPPAETEPEKPIPWGYIGAGVGVLALVAGGIYLGTRKSG